MADTTTPAPTDWANDTSVSNRDDVNAMYQSALGRTASDADYTASSGGSQTDQAIYAGLMKSPEYLAAHPEAAPQPNAPNIQSAPGTDPNSLIQYSTNPTPNGYINPALQQTEQQNVTNPTLPAGTQATAEQLDPNAAGTQLSTTDGQVSNPTAVTQTQAQAGTVDPNLANPTPTSTYTAEQIGAYTPQALAAQGQVDPRSLMQNQYTDLMNFPPEAVPDWAKGAAAVAKASLASSGLSNSSMAAGAITAALMQAALPIAQTDAKTFEDMNLANLSNQQQANIVNTQARVQTMMSDQAAVNASQQFNASSENQTKEFYSSLSTDVAKFNATQLSAISEFNAGEADSIAKFNTQLQSQTDQFNANNRLIIDQSNVQWQRSVNTANTAADNAANNTNASNLLSISNTAMNNMWQQMRDQANYSFTAGQNADNRAASFAIAGLNSQNALAYLSANYDAASQAALASGIGGVASKVVSGAVSNWLTPDNLDSGLKISNTTINTPITNGTE